MATIAVQVKMSDKMKEHLQLYADARRMTLSELMRLAVAKETRYSLTGDDELEGRGRPAKYQSEQERKEARRTQAQERKERTQRILRLVMEKERLDGAEALERYLLARGVNLEQDQDQEEAV